MSLDRMPPIPPERWTLDQHIYAKEIIDGPRGALISPFVPLLRSPELMAHAGRMGEYLRYRSALGLRLSELAILITARQWSQQVEWAIHAPIAIQEGVSPATVAAIAEGQIPDNLPDDEAVLYRFSIELHQNKSVSDATWNAAKQRFGEHGVMDLVGVNGYYAFLSMVMNAAKTVVPSTSSTALPPLPNN